MKGLHHHYIRKRQEAALGSKPEEDQWKKILNKLIYVVGIAGPIMTIPQVYQIYSTKDATGVSLISWASYLFISFFWLTYGIVHKEKPIILSYFGWIILETSIVCGVILYG